MKLCINESALRTEAVIPRIKYFHRTCSEINRLNDNVENKICILKPLTTMWNERKFLYLDNQLTLNSKKEVKKKIEASFKILWI